MILSLYVFKKNKSQIIDTGVHGLIIMWEGGVAKSTMDIRNLTIEGVKLERGRRFSPFNSVTKYWGGTLPLPSPSYAYDPI